MVTDLKEMTSVDLYNWLIGATEYDETFRRYTAELWRRNEKDLINSLLVNFMARIKREAA